MANGTELPGLIAGDELTQLTAFLVCRVDPFPGKSEMKTVLIVEDEAMVLVLAESVVQSAGYQTLTASSLAEARSIVESDAKIDIVFTDLSLGEETDGGIEVGNLVAEKRPGTSVLYTSGRGLTDGLSSLFVAGSDFLPKPYTDTQVVERLLNLAEGADEEHQRKA